MSAPSIHQVPSEQHNAELLAAEETQLSLEYIDEAAEEMEDSFAIGGCETIAQPMLLVHSSQDAEKTVKSVETGLRSWCLQCLPDSPSFPSSALASGQSGIPDLHHMNFPCRATLWSYQRKAQMRVRWKTSWRPALLPMDQAQLEHLQVSCNPPLAPQEDNLMYV